jgi:predicted DNA-binding protein (MmcQ/YjbR family)
LTEDPRLTRLTAICAELPEAERIDHPPHAQFRVRKRTFAYFLDDHHGDGIVGVTFKAPGSAPQALIDAHPDGRFYRATYLGSRGWVSLRLDRDHVDWTEVADLVTESYLQIAPKRLAAQVLG